MAPREVAAVAPRAVAAKVAEAAPKLESMEVAGVAEEVAESKLGAVPKGEVESWEEGKEGSQREASLPTPPPKHPRSKLHTYKVPRMTEDLAPGVQVTEPKDKNQNSLPDGDAGPSRSNGL